MNHFPQRIRYKLNHYCGTWPSHGDRQSIVAVSTADQGAKGLPSLQIRQLLLGKQKSVDGVQSYGHPTFPCSFCGCRISGPGRALRESSRPGRQTWMCGNPCRMLASSLSMFVLCFSRLGSTFTEAADARKHLSCTTPDTTGWSDYYLFRYSSVQFGAIRTCANFRHNTLTV